MIDPSTKRLCDLLQEMQAERSLREPTLQDIYDYTVPEDGYMNRRSMTGHRFNHVFETTGRRASLQFANFLHGVMMPESAPWAKLGVVDEDLNSLRPVREFFDIASAKIMALFRSTNYYSATFETMWDATNGGTGCVYMEERSRGMAGGYNNGFKGMYFCPIPLSDFWILQNNEGEIDTVARAYCLTAEEATRLFASSCPEVVRKAMGDNKPGKRFRFTQIVLPASTARYLGIEVMTRFDWVSATLCNGEDTYLGVSPTLDISGRVETVRSKGYRHFPFAVPRFNPRPGRAWATGLGDVAIGDIKEANAEVRKMLIALDKDIDPVWFVPSDSILADFSSKAGSVNYINPEDAQGIKQFGSGANWPVVAARLDTLRQNILEHYYVNKLQLPEKLDRATVPEIEQRRQDASNALGSIFGKMQREFPKKMVEFTFLTMLDAGVLPPMPPALEGMELEVNFDSPLAASQRQQTLAPVNTYIRELVDEAQLTQDPSRLDVIDWDALDRTRAIAHNIPTKLLRKDDLVAQIRQAREEERRLAMTSQGADALGKFIQRAGPQITQQR